MREEGVPAGAALWYVRYHQPDYMLCDDEEDAAGIGAAMMDDGGASVLGVQFPDGRTIALENWAAYAEAERRRDEAFARARATNEKPPMRKIQDPFTKRDLEVEVSEPGWLGLPQA